MAGFSAVGGTYESQWDAVKASVQRNACNALSHCRSAPCAIRESEDLAFLTVLVPPSARQAELEAVEPAECPSLSPDMLQCLSYAHSLLTSVTTLQFILSECSEGIFVPVCLQITVTARMVLALCVSAGCCLATGPA